MCSVYLIYVRFLSYLHVRMSKCDFKRFSPTAFGDNDNQSSSGEEAPRISKISQNPLTIRTQKSILPCLRGRTWKRHTTPFITVGSRRLPSTKATDRRRYKRRWSQTATTAVAVVIIAVTIVPPRVPWRTVSRTACLRIIFSDAIPFRRTPPLTDRTDVQQPTSTTSERFCALAILISSMRTGTYIVATPSVPRG